MEVYIYLLIIFVSLLFLIGGAIFFEKGTVQGAIDGIISIVAVISFPFIQKWIQSRWEFSQKWQSLAITLLLYAVLISIGSYIQRKLIPPKKKEHQG